MLLSVLAYCLHPHTLQLRWGVQRAPADLVCVLPVFWWSALAVLLRFSFACPRTWLVELGAFESAGGAPSKGVATAATALPWYYFRALTGQAALFFVWGAGLGGLPSVERLFRNGRWLEREVAEMHGLFFSAKRDRRALFLMPLVYWAPLRKGFPVGGFYDVRTHALTGKLHLSHVAWLE